MSEQTDVALKREDFINALQDMGTYIDVSVDDLMELQKRAQQFARVRHYGDRSVASLMSSPVMTVKADCSLQAAAHMLVTHKISGLPVVDEQHTLQGIITEADFLCALGVQCHHPGHNLWQTLEHMFRHAPSIGHIDAKVGELMSRSVVTVSPQSHVFDALDTMKRHSVKRLVVCDEADHVTGMLTRSDLVRVFFDRFNSAS